MDVGGVDGGGVDGGGGAADTANCWTGSEVGMRMGGGGDLTGLGACGGVVAGGGPADDVEGDSGP